MGVEGRLGELICLGVVHGHKELPWLDGGGDKGGDGDFSATGLDGDHAVGLDIELARIGLVDFDIAMPRGEFLQQLGFGGAGLGMPLA